jgi:hypothetical protein
VAGDAADIFATGPLASPMKALERAFLEIAAWIPEATHHRLETGVDSSARVTKSLEDAVVKFTRARETLQAQVQRALRITDA